MSATQPPPPRDGDVPQQPVQQPAAQPAQQAAPPARDREVIVTEGGGGGNSAVIGIIAAVVLVVLIVLGFMYLGGDSGDAPTVEVPDQLELDVEVDAPDAGGDEGGTQ